MNNNTKAKIVTAGGFVLAGIAMITAAFMNTPTNVSLIGVGGMFICLAAVFFATSGSDKVKEDSNE